jgi:hypothetical protein
VANAIAAGLQGNNELCEIWFYVRTCQLDMIVSGLGGHDGAAASSSSSNRQQTPSKKLESLSLWTDEPARNLDLGWRSVRGNRILSLYQNTDCEAATLRRLVVYYGTQCPASTMGGPSQ